MIFCIYGPPSVGKSTILGKIARLVSNGYFQTKINVVDMEAYYPDMDITAYQLLIKNATKHNNNVVVGMGGIPLQDETDITMNIIFHPRDLAAYKILCDKKKAKHPLGHGTQERIDKFNQFLKLKGEHFHDMKSIILFIEDTLLKGKR